MECFIVVWWNVSVLMVEYFSVVMECLTIVVECFNVVGSGIFQCYEGMF